MRIVKFNLALSAVVALLGAASAQAATFTPVLNYSGGAQNLSNPPYSLGYEFTTNSAVEVVALGIYDPAGSLSDSHLISLWDSAGNLLASTTVAAPNGTESVAGFDYNSISEVTLAANSTFYIGADYLTGNDFLLFPGQDGTFSTISSINYVQATYGDPGGFDNNPDGTNGFFGPNLGVVPEPAAWTLMLAGFAGMGAALRSRRRTVTAQA